MELRVERAGRLEWLVEPGAVVSAGAVLARLQVADHCAIVPLFSPAGGTVSWLRPAVLAQVRARTVVGLLDATPTELAVCACLLRSEARLLLVRLRAEQRELGGRLAGSAGLQRALLEDERVSLERRAGEVTALLGSLRLGVQQCAPDGGANRERDLAAGDGAAHRDRALE